MKKGKLTGKIFGIALVCAIVSIAIVPSTHSSSVVGQESLEPVHDSLEPFGANTPKPYENICFYDSAASQYVFTYADDKDFIEYSLSLNDWSIQHGLIKIRANINDSHDVYPVSWAGSRYRDLSGQIWEPGWFAEVAEIILTSHSLENGIVRIQYREVYEGITNNKTIEYRIKGKTLIFHIYSSNTNGNGNYAGFLFDRSEETPNPRAIEIPYSIDPIVTFGNQFFYSTYLDRSKSNSTMIDTTIVPDPPSSCACYSSSIYDPDSEGNITPLDETGYITVSNEAIDVIAKPNHEPSIYRDLLNDKVVLDLWGAPFGSTSYRTYEEILKELHQFGLTNLAVIDHHWMRYGWDTKLPSLYPANPDWGTEAELKSLINTAKSYGHLFALHENYWFMCQDSPYYDEDSIAKNADLSFREGPDPTRFPMASDKMIKYAGLEGNQIKTNYQTNAAFLDVNPAYDPEGVLHQIDFDASNPYSRSLSQAIRNTKNLFRHQQDLYQGPLFGEGGEGYSRYDSYYGGYVDGVERQILARYQAKLIPDFELLAVKPLMVNHGMGYPPRYFRNDDQPVDGDQVNWDLYRATEIAFGHAGYLTGLGISSEEEDSYVHRYPLGSLDRALVEYYMLQQLQSQYLSSDVTLILYEDSGQMVGLSQAIIDDIDFVNARIYIEYDNGLKLFVNHDQVDNWIVNLEGRSYHLPPNGWVALNRAIGFLEYSANVDANRVDYVKSPLYTFARSRTGSEQLIDDLTTDGTVALKRDELTNLREIHMVNTSVVDHTQAPYGIISTSAKCNLNLDYVDEYQVLFSIYNSDQETPDITYKDAPSSWRDNDGNLPSPHSGVISVWRIDSQGNCITSIPWTSLTGKEIRISNVVSGDYTITANSRAVGWCFIATAAYGTPMAEEIEILRQFRDEYLLTNPLGQALVGLYYRVSPPMAEFLTEHPSLKPIVRAGLVPAVAMSTVAVNTTVAEKMAILGLLVFVSVAVAVWAMRRRGRGPEYT